MKHLTQLQQLLVWIWFIHTTFINSTFMAHLHNIYSYNIQNNHNNYLSQQLLANITWCWAKPIGRIHFYFILDHKSKVN